MPHFYPKIDCLVNADNGLPELSIKVDLILSSQLAEDIVRELRDPDSDLLSADRRSTNLFALLRWMVNTPEFPRAELTELLDKAAQCARAGLIVDDGKIIDGTEEV